MLHIFESGKPSVFITFNYIVTDEALVRTASSRILLGPKLVLGQIYTKIRQCRTAYIKWLQEFPEVIIETQLTYTLKQ